MFVPFPDPPTGKPLIVGHEIGAEAVATTVSVLDLPMLIHIVQVLGKLLIATVTEIWAGAGQDVDGETIGQ